MMKLQTEAEVWRDKWAPALLAADPTRFLPIEPALSDLLSRADPQVAKIWVKPRKESAALKFYLAELDRMRNLLDVWYSVGGPGEMFRDWNGTARTYVVKRAISYLELEIEAELIRLGELSNRKKMSFGRRLKLCLSNLFFTLSEKLKGAKP